MSNKSVRKGLDILVGEQLIFKIDHVGSRVSESIPGFQSTIILGFSPSIERDICLSALLSEFDSLYPDKLVKTVQVKSVADFATNYERIYESYTD